MNLIVETERIPLHEEADGVLRIAVTRVTLDSVVAAFDEGATAEEIVCQYPTLGLAAVYAVISYVLNHRPEVDSYLRRRKKRRQQVRSNNSARFCQDGIRQRLLARRRAGKEEQDASARG